MLPIPSGHSLLISERHWTNDAIKVIKSSCTGIACRFYCMKGRKQAIVFQDDGLFNQENL